MAAPPFVAAAGASLDNQTSVTINVPTGTQAGDLMVAVLTSHTSADQLTHADWTSLTTVTTETSDMETHVLYRVAGASEPASYNFGSQTVNDIVGIIATYRDADPTTPIHAFAVSAVTGTSTSVVTPSVTTTVADCTILSIGSFRSAGATITAPGGATSRHERDGNGAITFNTGLADLVAAAPGSHSGGTWTCSASARRTAVTIAIAPRSGNPIAMLV